MNINLTNPQALWLLLLLPLVLAIMAWPRRHLYGGHVSRLLGQLSLRHGLSVAVRMVIVLLIVLALSGLQQVQSTDNLATMFILDMSDSVGEQGQAVGVSYIQQALSSMGVSDRGGLVVFGADALVERTASSNPNLRDIASVPVQSYSDLAGAIRLALASLPNDAAKRLVILSDGAENVGDARQAAQIAAANGVEIATVQLPTDSGIEVRLVDLQAPSMLREGEQFDLTLSLFSTTAMSVPIQIFTEGQLVAQDTLQLQSGDQSFSIPQIAGQSGFSTFEARIFPPQDTFIDNNVLESFSEVEGPANLLMVAANPSEGQPVAEALRSTGLPVTQIGPSDLPSDLRRLSDYRAVILVNLPSFLLAPRQLDLLQTYVRDLGGGLIVIGGERSYGPGGYFQTVLEDTLPVEMTITDKERLPGMTIMMIIDKSGSMANGGNAPGSPRKVELAKEAIYRSIDLLVPWDRIGVVAFDNAARWVLKPTPVTNIKAIKDAVGTIRASGGTDILAGLQVGAEAMLKETTQVRHIVLLTDGGADSTGIVELTKKLADAGVTTSVVAIGHGYAPFLEEVAKIGGGRFHFADNAAVIPQIFAQETSLASRSYLVEETYTPEVVSPSPMLDGLTRLPQLHGHVATSSKLTARTVLVGGPQADPLLVEWQYGLGRAVAWTSDAKGQWAAEWLSWSEFPRFWSQVVRSTLVESASGGLESEIRLEGDQAKIRVEILDEQGRYRNNLETALSLVDPDFNQQTIQLEQVAPGLYEGHFRPDRMGTYFMRIVGREGETMVAAQTRGFVMAYSPEYRTLGMGEAARAANLLLLTDLAEIGRGQLLPLDAPAEAFAHTLPPAQAATDLWPWLLLLALLLLPLDVGLRRIIFGVEEVRLLWQRLRGHLPQPSGMATGPSTTGTLLKTKNRASSQRKRSWQRPTPPDPTTPPAGTTSPRQAAPSAKPQAATPSDDEETVQRLLRAKAKRRRRRGG